MSRRAISLVGVHNFRDFGGCRTHNGAAIVDGRLFRCAHLHDVTATDAASLDALGVKFLVDLRHPDERARFPNKWNPERILAGDQEPLSPAPSGQQSPADGVYSAETGRALMRLTYARIPYHPRVIAMLGNLFRALAEDGGPMIVHCTVGKDRTGIACALLLHTLGVDRDAIFEDFLATNSSIDRVERARLLRAELEPLHGPLSDEKIEPVIGVEAQYLQESFDTIERESGSIDGYVTDTLGVSHQIQERLRLLLRTDG